MTIIERTLDCLEKQNKKMSELCVFIGIGTSTMANWKTRNTDPSAKYVPHICEFLNVSVDWLLTGEGEMNKQTIDIQPKVSDEEKLDIDEELLLSNYKKLDKNSKVEFLNLVILKTLEAPKCKLYHSTNAKDEILTAYELERIAS